MKLGNQNPDVITLKRMMAALKLRLEQVERERDEYKKLLEGLCGDLHNINNEVTE